MEMNNKTKIDKELEDALRNTTAGKFNELGKAMQQIGEISLEEFSAAVQKIGRRMNAVPPYEKNWKDVGRSRISVFHIMKIAIVVTTAISIFIFFLM